MRNAEIAAAFDELGDLYELDGAVVYRVVAYRNAAKAIRESRRLGGGARARRAGRRSSPGSARRSRRRSTRCSRPGEIPAADKLKAKFPGGLVEVTRIPGLGPKSARKLYDELGIDVARRAARRRPSRSGCADVPGFGAKAEENMLAALARRRRRARRSRACCCRRRSRSASEMVDGAARAPGRASASRSPAARGAWPTPARTSTSSRPPTDPRGARGGVRELDADRRGAARAGEAGARARHPQRLRVDLRDRRAGEFGNLLQHLTGSEAAQRGAARPTRCRRGLHVSRVRRRRRRDGETHACATEEEVYELLGMRLHRARAAREPRRDRGGARRASCPSWSRVERHPRRPALPHDRSRTGATRSSRWPTAAQRARLRVPRDHRPLGHVRLRQRRAAGRAAAPDRAVRELNDGWTGFDAARGHRGEHAARRLARLRRRRARAARLGRGQPALLLPHEARRR